MEMIHIKNHYQSLILLALIGALYLSSLPVQAQGTSTASSSPREAVDERREAILENQAQREEAIETRQASSTERQEIREERQVERTEIREERRATLAAFRQERIINLAANISNRMDAATERLFNVIGRLEARMQKLAANGIDTTAPTAKLREASQTLAEAKTALADIDALVYAATTSEQPRNDWQAVRERYVVVGGLIRQTHAELRETIALLKAAVSAGPRETTAGVPDSAATSTATTSDVTDIEVI